MKTIKNKVQFLSDTIEYAKQIGLEKDIIKRLTSVRNKNIIDAYVSGKLLWKELPNYEMHFPTMEHHQDNPLFKLKGKHAILILHNDGLLYIDYDRKITYSNDLDVYDFAVYVGDDINDVVDRIRDDIPSNIMKYMEAP